MASGNLSPRIKDGTGVPKGEPGEDSFCDLE